MNNYTTLKTSIEDRAAAMGNGILLANSIILPYNNFKTYGKLYSQGFRNAEKRFRGTYARELGERVNKE
jgi:hypothetical protein